MVPVLLFLLSLSHLHATSNCAIVDASKYDLNNLLESSDEQNEIQIPPELSDDDLFGETTTASVNLSDENVPVITSDHDRTDVTFKEPIAAISIDYAKNKLRLSFQKNRQASLRKLYDLEEQRRRKSLEKNFMRFGKREKEELPSVNSIEYEFSEQPMSGSDTDALQRYERSQGARDARGDNFMRFGRTPKDFMRFGRAPALAADFMRFGRSPNQDFLRFGKSQADFMRFGRSPADNYMRFGRNPSHDFMRFGRNPQLDFMRFGRAQKAQRSADKHVMSFGRNAADFIRFGRATTASTELPHNFMRFGKSGMKQTSANQTMPLLQKSEIREAAKLLHKSEEGGDESNPVDKAIKVLFKQHRAEAAERSHEALKNRNDDADDNVEQFDDTSAMEYGYAAN